MFVQKCIYHQWGETALKKRNLIIQEVQMAYMDIIKKDKKNVYKDSSSGARKAHEENYDMKKIIKSHNNGELGKMSDDL